MIFQHLEAHPLFFIVYHWYPFKFLSIAVLMMLPAMTISCHISVNTHSTHFWFHGSHRNPTPSTPVLATPLHYRVYGCNLSNHTHSPRIPSVQCNRMAPDCQSSSCFGAVILIFTQPADHRFPFSVKHRSLTVLIPFVMWKYIHIDKKIYRFPYC